MAKKKDTKIKITQTKSAIGYNVKQKRTLEALGLKKLNHSVVHNSTPQIEGMVTKVKHLVSVEDAN
ncbi:MAG: 50S ribosomal protein L30 [Calditrichaeota bacterium]|nr:MAG: 50S ribosomal protein L30 [Calditrichota bacterium]MBL1205006.1 50S ribosomal protein L30 [Calditrichota bacterium]NOG44836.1 50S ribosomal protein L30 [Calditrichota bacterium]